MLRRSQWQSIASLHHPSDKPGCTSTTAVPSWAHRAALSAVPFVSGRYGADVS